MLLGKFKRPSVYIGILVTSWGLVVTFSGLTKSFAGLAVTRFLIGVFEAGLFPAAVYLISTWYPPNKTGTRTGIFYVSSAASGAFSGLLAAGIAQMNGLGGLQGWRWIFIIEGIISVLFGLSTFFLLPDSPALSGRWLTEEEQRFLQLMNQATRGTGASTTEPATGVPAKKKTNWQAVRAMISDPHIYLQAIVFSSNAIPNNGMKYTMPQIVRNMGYKSTAANLMSAPPYICGAFATILGGYYGDKVGNRMRSIVFFQTLVLAMAVLFKFVPDSQNNIALCYTMVIIACMGCILVRPAPLNRFGFVSNNFDSHTCVQHMVLEQSGRPEEKI